MTVTNQAAIVNAQTATLFADDINYKNMVKPTNQSGGDLATGAVVVVDSANDNAFKTSTTVDDQTVLGVIPQIDDVNRAAGTQTIANNAAGYVQFAGYVATLNVQGNVTRGHYLRCSTTAGRAEDAGATPTKGSFAIAVTAYAGGGAGTVSATLLTRATDPSVYATPTGIILMYGGAAAPSGFLLCDGSAVSRTTYAALFVAISTTFGVGDNSTTFNVPDLRHRAPIGAGSVHALGANDGVAEASRTPNHVHAETPHAHAQNSAAGYSNDVGNGGPTIAASDSNSGMRIYSPGGGAAVLAMKSGVVATGASNTGSAAGAWEAVNFIIKT